MSPRQIRSKRATHIYTLNIDGVPVYVGLTVRDPAQRLFEHLESAATKRTKKDRVLAAAQHQGSTVSITVIETVPPGLYTDQEERQRERLEGEGYLLLNSKCGDQLNALTRSEEAALRAATAEWRRTNRPVLNRIKRKQNAALKKRQQRATAQDVIARLKATQAWLKEHGL